MKLYIVLLFAFTSLLLLFYPGASRPYTTYAYHRDLFAQNTQAIVPHIDLVPVATSSAQPVITAEVALIADEKTLSPVYERESTKHMLPASTTKIITALVAYDLYTPDEIILVKKAFDEGQIMELMPGEKITFENLMYGILVHSANDAAYTVAHNYGMDRFVDLMNKKAKELHMDDSYFVNPTGLHDPRQQTTAIDLARAARVLLRNRYLSKIAATKEITISDVDFKYFHQLVNVNKLLGEIQGIGGLKSGYTIEAGENLVTRYKRRDGNEMLIVVLKSEDRFEDTKQLVNWIENTIQYVKPEI